MIATYTRGCNALSSGRQLIGADAPSDYNADVQRVLDMNNLFNAIGRPGAYETKAEQIWAAYEKAKTPAFGSSWGDAAAMKKAGADALELTNTLRAGYLSKPADPTSVPAASTAAVAAPASGPKLPAGALPPNPPSRDAPPFFSRPMWTGAGINWGQGLAGIAGFVGVGAVTTIAVVFARRR